MRVHVLGLMLIFSLAAPAAAQQSSRPRQETTEQRLGRIEQQLRAVQRRVFPNGTQQFVEPEIPAEVQAAMGGAPQGSAITSLSDRLDAIEGQVRALTGQIEEQGNRNRQIDEQLTRLRADLAAQQAAAAERAAAAAAPAPRQPERSAAAPARTPAAAPADTPDDAEEAYNAGYRLWDQRRYAEAQAALDRAATRFPNSRWASWARNMQGRAFLDDNKPATAARILLANYQNNPRGERAADSLFYLGQALTRLNRRPEACRVYDELAQVYPDMRDFLRERLPQARRDARCGSGT